MIGLHQASVSYGPVVALSGVDLQIQKGDRLALVGANGSGKSSLLKALHGLVPISSGRRDVQGAAGGAREPVMAMLFQKPFLLNVSVQANLHLALWLRGVPRDQRRPRVQEALARVGLSDRAHRFARTLSGGQQQRLALARAWATRPDVLFLDEPTASLDPGAKREVESLITEFAAEGLTVVMSTHNLGQVKRLAHRVAYLEAGQLLVNCTVDEFFNGPVPAQAAQFLRGELAWR
jgi:tungstate transport system ATP-binding protein